MIQSATQNEPGLLKISFQTSFNDVILQQPPALVDAGDQVLAWTGEIYESPDVREGQA